MGSVKPWVNTYWPKADVFWEYAKKTSYYQEILDTDVFKGRKATENLGQKFTIWLCKNFDGDSRTFRFIQGAAWFAMKVFGKFSVL